jgi:type II secretory pathway pseudopilin PulG
MARQTSYGDARVSLPRVNLLPKEIKERRLAQRRRGGIVVAFVVVLALLGLWYVRESQKLTEARAEAERERSVAAGLRARKTELQPYAALGSQIAAADQLRAKVYAREIRFSSILQDISAIIPSDVWLTQMSVALKETAAGGGGNAAAAAALTPGSPGAGSPVATITFTGAGLAHADVGGFVQALSSGPKRRGSRVYLNPYFTASQKDAEEGGETTVTFSATVDLSQAAFSGRFQAGGKPATVTP